MPTLNVSLTNPGTCFRPGDDWQSRETTWNWRESSQRPTLNLLFFNILQIGKLASVQTMLPSCSEQAVIIEVVQRNIPLLWVSRKVLAMKPSANRVQVCNSSRVEDMFGEPAILFYRRYLYGAVLDKGRSPVPSGKANKQASTLPGMFICHPSLFTRAILLDFARKGTLANHLEKNFFRKQYKS